DRHGPDPRRGELHGEGQPVGPGHDVRDDVVGQLGVGSYGAGTSTEQLLAVGGGELAEGEDALRRDPQRRPAGGDHAQVTGGGEQEGDQRGDSVEQVLTVVEGEQGRNGVELLGDPAPHVGELGGRQRVPTGHRVPYAEGGPDLGDDVLG